MVSPLVEEIVKCAAHARPVSRLRIAVSEQEMREIELEMRWIFGVSHAKIMGIDLIVDGKLTKTPSVSETWD